MRLPKISINICVISNGDASIVLNSLKKLDYPKHLIEIIIIEGTQLARQRNEGLRHSLADIVYLLDNDSVVQPNALRIVAKEFSEPSVAAVGGPSLTPAFAGNMLSRLIGHVLETHFGALRMRFRYSQQKKYSKQTTEHHLLGANLALRKKAVLALGGFNERIMPNEETELLRRLKRHGYSLRYSDALYIYRHQRSSIPALIQQFHHYGKGRMKQIIVSPQLSDFSFGIPVCFAFYLPSLSVYHPLWFLLPLCLYLFLAFATSLKAAVKYKKIHLFFLMPVVFPVVHLSYAGGLLTEGVVHTVSLFRSPTPIGKSRVVEKLYVKNLAFLQ